MVITYNRIGSQSPTDSNDNVTEDPMLPYVNRSATLPTSNQNQKSVQVKKTNLAISMGKPPVARANWSRAMTSPGFDNKQNARSFEESEESRSSQLIEPTHTKKMLTAKRQSLRSPKIGSICDDASQSRSRSGSSSQKQSSGSDWLMNKEVNYRKAANPCKRIS